MKEILNYKIKQKSIDGITLIALVITVIVLLILAGISINMLTGENSILTQAGRARDKTTEANNEEQARLTQMSALLNLNGTVTNEGVNIPAGFAVSEKEGENKLKDGVVMVDSRGNEYVWVEVPNANQGGNPEFGPDYASQGLTSEKIEEETITDSQKSKIETALINYVTKDLLNGNNYKTGRIGWKDEWYSGCGISSPEEYTALYKKMLKSVYNNGGFWIGRYEAGTINPRDTESDSIDGLIPLSKADLYPIYYVTCAQAQTIASRVNNIGDKSCSLMFGIQWDCVLKYLQKRGNLSKSDLTSDCKKFGNFNNSEIKLNRGKYNIYDAEEWELATWKDYFEKTDDYVNENHEKIKNKDEGETAQGIILLTTGASETSKILNIYDIAGNIDEWTLEHATSNSQVPCSTRGGNFVGTDSYGPCSGRGSVHTLFSIDCIRFPINNLLMENGTVLFSKIGIGTAF